MTVTLDAVENLLAEYRSLKTVPRNLRTIKALERLLELLADMDENDAPPVHQPVHQPVHRPLGCYNGDRSGIVGWKDGGACQHDSRPDPDCDGCGHQKARAFSAPLDGTGGV